MLWELGSVRGPASGSGRRDSLPSSPSVLGSLGWHCSACLNPTQPAGTVQRLPSLFLVLPHRRRLPFLISRAVSPCPSLTALSSFHLTRAWEFPCQRGCTSCRRWHTQCVSLGVVVTCTLPCVSQGVIDFPRAETCLTLCFVSRVWDVVCPQQVYWVKDSFPPHRRTDTAGCLRAAHTCSSLYPLEGAVLLSL